MPETSPPASPLPSRPAPKPKKRRAKGKPRRKLGKYAPRPGLRQEQIEKALRATAGIYRYAAKKLKCAPNTVRNHVLRSAYLQRVLTEVADDNLDNAEHAVKVAIDAGNITAAFFYLKCKGKARGWVERQEITGSDGGPVAIEDARSILLERVKKLAGRDEPGTASEADPGAPAERR
jgi:hypothetical protein